MLLKNIFYFVDSFRNYNLFEKPIFIISAPRSGSTLLYDLFLNFDGLYGYSVETDDVWWRVFPKDRLDDKSDYVGINDCNPKAVSLFRRTLYRYLVWDLERQNKKVSILFKLGLKRIRYVEKTIANCFHLDAIMEIFPDAYFVWLVRDPRATYSSMLVGWKGSKRAEIFHQLDPLRNLFSIDLFPYPYPPNWQENMLSKIEAEAFAWALLQYYKYPYDFFKNFPKERMIFLRYEDLIDDTLSILEEIASKFDLQMDAAVINMAKNLPLSRTTVQKPQKDKWKRLHGHIIYSDNIFPFLEKAAKIAGYHI